MKNKNDKYIIICFVIIILFCIIQFIIEINNPKISGRDTILSLGDGTYQVVVSQHLDDDYSHYSLVEISSTNYPKHILYEILKYKIDNKNKLAYFIGLLNPNKDDDFIYLIVDYKNYKYKQISCNEKITTEYQLFVEDIVSFKEFKNYNPNNKFLEICKH